MKNNKSGLKTYLLLVFLAPYLLWGFILLAQELGWFNYGESFSVVLVVIAANFPSVAAFFALRREQPNYSLKNSSNRLLISNKSLSITDYWHCLSYYSLWYLL